MPTVILVAAVLGGILLVVAALPQLEIRLPRRYRDIIYVRLRRNGGRIDLWRGKPVRMTRSETFEWESSEAWAFDNDGVPTHDTRALQAVRDRLAPYRRRFPFGPIIVLHAIDKAMRGLETGDRERLNRLGYELGGLVLVGDLPNAFPERAFAELRENGLAVWSET
ncbi:MAG: hypothetical protein ACMVY4_10300 [Minwuia sp.]|uniref:hypothetical protein n=1 Tax=Minwuia sp. TaxID=2493630 RepID=UPI003A86B6D3